MFIALRYMKAVRKASRRLVKIIYVTDTGYG